MSQPESRYGCRDASRLPKTPISFSRDRAKWRETRRIPVIAYFLYLVMRTADADEPLRLMPVGLSNGELRVNVTGQGHRVVVEASTNLLDWTPAFTNELVGGAMVFADPDVSQRPLIFYRGRMILLPELTPSRVNLFAGDTILFRVNEGPPGTAWIFSVNGSVNGKPDVGLMLAAPDDPAAATYLAPNGVSTPITVTVCAEDANDPTRRFCATVTVYPLPATLAVQPGAVTLRLGGSQEFQAGAEVPGVGFVPLNRVVWKINGSVGTDPTGELGRVDLDGLYTAPLRMPPALPRFIEVGVSTSPEGPILASARVTLAEVSVAPPKIVSIQSGPAGQVTATLRLSDGSVSSLAPGQVAFSSGWEEVATVSGYGEVSVGDTLGTASIFATHLATGATSSMVVESRPDVHLRLLNVRQRSPHVININPTASGVTFSIPDTPIHEIEVTQPGVLLNLIPDIFFFRGATNLNTLSLAGAGNQAVSFRGDGKQVLDFEIGGRVPQPEGLVARVERHTGFVEFGDTPGSGVVAMTYDDGVVTRTATTTLRFTRLNLAAELRGTQTGRTNEAYVSEWLELKIKVTNPRTQSSRFMGDTLIRVRQQGEPFLVAYIPETDYRGLVVLPFDKEYLETTEYVHRLPSGPSNRNPSLWMSDLGEIRLWIMAQRGGEHRFTVDMPSDPGVPPVEQVINLRLPELRLRPLGGVTNGSPIVLNSYFDLEFATDTPSLLDTPMHPDVTFGRGAYHLRETLVWFVKRPGGQTNVLLANLDAGLLRPFPTTLREPGIHEIWLGYRDRPGIRTESVRVHVVSPAGGQFDEPPALARGPVTDEGTPVPPENQYAALHIVSPTVGGFADNAPLRVTTRLYGADGKAKRLGKRVISRFRQSNRPDLTSFTTNYVIGGVFVSLESSSRYAQINTANTLNRLHPADANGYVTFEITVPRPSTTSQYWSPVRFKVEPGFVTVAASQVQEGAYEDLPVEFLDHLDGVLVSATRIPLGVSEYMNPADNAYKVQLLDLPAHSVTPEPAVIPVASPRVREAVAAGKLPAGSDHAVFTLRGNEEFAAALAVAEPEVFVLDQSAFDLEPGVVEVATERVAANALRVSVATDLDYYEQDPFDSRYGDRIVLVRFPDGTRWMSRISLVGCRIQAHESLLDRNVPLNAAYGYVDYNTAGQLQAFRDEEGAALYEIVNRPFYGPVTGVDLELVPSLHAVWDANRNGTEDPGEDIDGDGQFTENDVALPVVFRGARPENPLVGFRRDVDPRTGAYRVRQLVKRMAPSSRPQFHVFADPTDHRRLNRQTATLGEKFDPDGIPDFVSPRADAEMLLARVGPNLCDVRFFSVYNFMAEVRQDLPDPGYELNRLLQQPNPLDAVYGAYSAAPGNLLLGSQALNTWAARPVQVYVDHDARPTDFHPEAPFLSGFYPFQFYAGVLDQPWQRRVININSAGISSPIPLFNDDRLRPYESRYLGGPPTGAQRAFFGADLDGVLYDPSYLTPWDESPNSAALRSIPVVGATLGDTILTPANLLQRIGGTSGGFVDLTRWHPGRLAAEAKTPGADVPGLHAGFLLFGRPEQLKDPRNSLVEDDIRDVLLKRSENGTLIRENRFFGAPAPRFVHGFAKNEDRKDSIRTAAQANLRFAVVTDPPNVVPDDPANWKVRSHILVREQLAPDNSPDLIVTSQSDGNEQIIKLAADQAVNWAVDLTASVLLPALTGGGMMAPCGAIKLKEKVLGSLWNFSMSVVDQEILQPYFEKNHRDAILFVHRNLTTAVTTTSRTNVPIPGVNSRQAWTLLDDQLIRPVVLKGLTNALQGLSSNVLHRLGVTNRALHFDIPQNLRLPNAGQIFRLQQLLRTNVPNLTNSSFSICDVFNQPFDLLKNEIKASYSAETFGGLGSAEALGLKVLSVAIPEEAQISPGVFSLTYSATRKIDVQPKEPDEVSLASLPWQKVFTNYPYADVMPDEEFLRTLLGRRFDTDPEVAQAATQIWRAVQRKTVRRDVRDFRYQSYKIRAWQLPGIAADIAPFQQTGTGQTVGDFALTPNVSVIPVSVAAGVMVSRANENATARALVTTPGYEMILQHGTLMKPRTQP